MIGRLNRASRRRLARQNPGRLSPFAADAASLMRLGVHTFIRPARRDEFDALRLSSPEREFGDAVTVVWRVVPGVHAKAIIPVSGDITAACARSEHEAADLLKAATHMRPSLIAVELAKPVGRR
ncbi:hypothetical protein [Methylobacterium sp. WSM2598]|uniref:hypothetical protein n=1 Tax=Methylobacterium sp. WSM2598 TaxID=398261 RepID=UPI00036E2D68|nr:hypothetical protein [Methylobacterium sp. WSM2598]